MSEINMGTMYEMNQQLMSGAPPATKEQITKYTTQLMDWFKNKKYTMLLCNDRHDFTLFENITKIHAENAPIQKLFECFKGRFAEVQSMEFLPDGAVEIWLKIDNKSYCYYLFDYANGIIKY